MNYTLRVLILVLPLFLSYKVRAAAAAAASSAGRGSSVVDEVITRDFASVRYVRTDLKEKYIIEEDGSCYIPPTIPPVPEMEPAGGTAEAGEAEAFVMPMYASSFESAPEVVLGKLFDGIDGREPVTSPEREWLHRVHAQINTRFRKGIYGGSGTLIGPRHLLTAGHNLFDANNGWALSIAVRCALDGGHRPFGEKKVVKAFTYKRWVEELKKEYDIALFVLDEPVGFETGWYGLAYIPNSMKTILEETEFWIAGYPKKVESTRYEAAEPKTEDDYFRKMWRMSNRREKGTISRLEYDETSLFYLIDTSAGQSGSAIWYVQEEDGGAAAGEDVGKPYVIGVHAYGNKEGERNHGTRITKSKFDQIMGWIEDTYEVKEIVDAEDNPGELKKKP